MEKLTSDHLFAYCTFSSSIRLMPENYIVSEVFNIGKFDIFSATIDHAIGDKLLTKIIKCLRDCIFSGYTVYQTVEELNKLIPKAIYVQGEIYKLNHTLKLLDCDNMVYSILKNGQAAPRARANYQEIINNYTKLGYTFGKGIKLKMD